MFLVVLFKESLDSFVILIKSVLVFATWLLFNDTSISSLVILCRFKRNGEKG